MKKNTIKGRIISTRYKSTSYYGNPKYFVSFENVETGEHFWGETANNAACAYGINNSEFKKPCTITYHITRTGNVIVDFIRK